MRDKVIILAISGFIGLFSNCAGIKEDKEGRFIQDFIDKNKFEITSIEANIENIYIHGIKHSPAEYINIKIPVGTVLSPSLNSFQNMLCYEDIERICYSSVDIEIPVVCINLHKNVPEDNVSFTFFKESNNQELNSFIENLSKIDMDEVYAFTVESVSNKEVIQAAAWIISDDANYEELGVLSIGGLLSNIEDKYGLFRAIQSQDAAHALMLLKACGIDIKSKKIWNDRFYIYDNIFDSYPETKSNFGSLIDAV